MLRWLIRKRLDRLEKQLGASVDYLRYILDVSLAAFLRFARAIPLAGYRRKLPLEPYHVALLVATRHEDCGSCVQIAVNLAKQAGVRPAILQTVLDGRPEALPEELAEAYRFAEAVVTRNGEEDLHRERIRQRHGDAGLVELALAIAGSRIFPTTKRALGYATSCSRVVVQV